MTWPTARNLSLPRADIERIGLFDERFRTTCEDQDLAQRARRIGIRFVYATEIDCVHNDQAADLARYCNFQERGARDTVALCGKSPELHGGAEIIRVNGPISRTDGIALTAEEAHQIRACTEATSRALNRAIAGAERAAASGAAVAARVPSGDLPGDLSRLAGGPRGARLRRSRTSCNLERDDDAETSPPTR